MPWPGTDGCGQCLVDDRTSDRAADVTMPLLCASTRDSLRGDSLQEVGQFRLSVAVALAVVLAVAA
eukprot:3197688-Pleurochrysis_carterae.AAC.1